jgi:phospholipid/cholesterol/gamma-HCH transport system substrate-binding protein
MAEESDKRAVEDQSRGSLPGFAQVLLPRGLGIKVGMLLAFTIMLIGGFIVYVLYERGTFEDTQRLRLIADNAEGIGVGTDLTFAGFPIGRVRRIRLREDGKVRISVRVPVSEAKWLRESSIFVIDVPLVGAAKLRVFTANLHDSPLPDLAERPVLRGDTAQEIPRMVATLRSVLENIEEVTKQGGSIQASLANLRTVSERLAGKSGALAAVLGSEDDARKVIATIERANALLGTISGVSKKLDDILVKTDRRVYGEGGVMDGTQQAVTQANAILGEVRTSLKKVDAILADAQVVSGNAKTATAELGSLRAEVDASLRKIGGLIDEINRKWPFERKTDIKLP